MQMWVGLAHAIRYCHPFTTENKRSIGHIEGNFSSENPRNYFKILQNYLIPVSIFKLNCVYDRYIIFISAPVL